MKKVALILAVFFCVGCAEKVQSYLEHPSQFIRDPHFTEYRDKRDDLEKQYLSKEITYSDYVNERDDLDAVYDKEVLERKNIIASDL